MSVLAAFLPEEIYIRQNNALAYFKLVAILVRDGLRLVVFVRKIVIDRVEMLPEGNYFRIIIVSVLLQSVQL